MANTHELATTDYMNAQRVVQNCVLKNQSTVIEEMIRANLISEEYLYPFADDVMEWWLIDSWLAERLKAQGTRAGTNGNFGGELDRKSVV